MPPTTGTWLRHVLSYRPKTYKAISQSRSQRPMRHSSSPDRPHEAVVQHPSAHARRTGRIELDRGHHGRVGGQKEVAIYGWEHCYQKRSRYAQLEARTHKCASRLVPYIGPFRVTFGVLRSPCFAKPSLPPADFAPALPPFCRPRPVGSRPSHLELAGWSAGCTLAAPVN